MSTRSTRVAIVGGGLSGLLAALLLEQQGIADPVLLEARSVLGGRIRSIGADGRVVDPLTPGHDRFDLGPSWFWPGFQPELDGLIRDLGLQRFEQFEQGDLLVEQGLREPPRRLRGLPSAPKSMRLVGGTGALISALHARLNPESIVTGQTVQALHHQGPQIELHSRGEGEGGQPMHWHADHVLLALPPRLAEQLEFDPPLPPALAQRWRATATWMAPQAKYVAIYGQPFWREQGLSGSARSGVGPMVEIHDASMPDGHAALFGFLGVPAGVRAQVTAEDLRVHCRAQLARLFGEAAGAPKADALQDWATDPLTATGLDQDASGHHAVAPPSSAEGGEWQGRLTGIASEWSPQFPGYLAGAVEAAVRGVHGAVAALGLRPPTP